MRYVVGLYFISSYHLLLYPIKPDGRTPAPVLPASSLYNSFFPLSLAYPLTCIGIPAYAERVETLLNALLAARGRALRLGPAAAAEVERVVSSTAAGPAGGRTRGVRARKVRARVTELNILGGR